MKNILISAYAISPSQGSEFGVGWNFVIHLSRHFNLTVLFGTSEERMGVEKPLYDYLKSYPLPNINFIFVRPSKKTKIFDWLNHNVATIFFYFALKSYNKDVYNTAKTCLENKKYDFLYQLNPIGFRNPGFLWKMGIPFIWGPVGGTVSLDARLFSLLDIKSKFRHVLRNLTNKFILNYSGNVRGAVKSAKLIFAATNSDAMNLRKYYNVYPEVMRENNVTQINKIKLSKSKAVQLIWVGRIDGSKSLATLLRSLAIIKVTKEWRLNIVGDGPLLNECLEIASDLQLNESITWHGKLPRDQVMGIYASSDVHISTSIMDSNPTVLIEAFEYGLPTIAIDGYGFSDLIDPTCGIKIPINKKRKLIYDYARAIETLIENELYLNHLKDGAHKKSTTLIWDQVILRMVNKINEAH